MKNSYRFFQNRECEFFPCHKTDKEEDFNCMFCYCPLYMNDNCPGRPEYILNSKGQRIKDCSNCMVVHTPSMYDRIIELLQQSCDAVYVNVWEHLEEIMERIAEIASWDHMEQDVRRQQEDAAGSLINMLMQDGGNTGMVTVALQPFSPECIGDGYFIFGHEKISCNVLAKIDRSKITSGYMYAFHAPLVSALSDGSLLTDYYAETFQVACMDVIRTWLQKYIERKESVYTRSFCSPSFGPGYYGMDVQAVSKLIGIMDAGLAGIRLVNGIMDPLKSIVGMYIVSRENIIDDCRDCESCIGNSDGCRFCNR